MNLHREYLKCRHMTIADWIQHPNDFCDVVLDYIQTNYSYLMVVTMYVLPTTAVLYPKLTCFNSKRFKWNLHKIHVIEGYVHSIFIQEPMKLDRYLSELFQDQTISVNTEGREELWVGGIRIA